MKIGETALGILLVAVGLAALIPTLREQAVIVLLALGAIVTGVLLLLGK